MVERKMEKSMEEMDLEYIANSNLEWSKYKNKTIFVTGATGLIGSLLVKAFAYYNCLHQGNIKIIGLIRNEEKAKRIYGIKLCVVMDFPEPFAPLSKSLPP